LLLIGSPREISFEFQYLLDAYWCVGRLFFENVDDYRAYADHVVAYESGATVPNGKQITMFAPRNDADRSTAFFNSQVAIPLASGPKRLGEGQGFHLTTVLAEEATKEALNQILNGNAHGTPPSLLFTGSHGAYSGLHDPQQANKIGALITQNWPGPGNPLKSEHCFAASDLGSESKIHGLVHFFFACYGGGCPKFDTYSKESKRIAPEAFVSHLPQAMLKQGALASIAHIDRAFASSFQTSRQKPQIQDIRGVLVQLMQGQRVGQCMDAFNLRWSVLAGEYDLMQRQREIDPAAVSDAVLAACWLARDDARNYAVFGDPAVRLRVDIMKA
jgi:hypothetical protein